MIKNLECDGEFPDGFDETIGIQAQYLRLANSILFNTIGIREWDVPCTAEHIRQFITELSRT